MSNDSNQRRVSRAPAPPRSSPRGNAAFSDRPVVSWGAGTRPAAQSAKVDWEEWRYRLKAELWKAVALSLDYDPDALMRREPTVSFDNQLRSTPREFQRRLAVARDYAEEDRLPIKYLQPDAAWSEVAIEDFVAWATRLGWSLPAELLRGADPARTRARGRTIGSGSYADEDAPLIQEMCEILQVHPSKSLFAVATQLAPRAAGSNTKIDSKAKRLVKRYRERHAHAS